MTTHEFLHALFGNDDGYIELRSTTQPAVFISIRPPHRGHYLSDYLNRLRNNPKMLPYFGVALRREPTNGRFENCKALTVLFADCDFKEHGEEHVRAEIAKLPYPPSIVVNSGNGLHLYWRLTQPLTDMKRAAKLLDQWVRTISVADWGVNDVARVLRLPGTLNHKYEPPRQCFVEAFTSPQTYEVEDLEIHAQQCALARGESVPEAQEIQPAWILPQEITAGERHGQLYRFMRSIQSRYGLSFEEVYPLMRAVNGSRCNPPISEGDLQKYLRRGWRNADRAGFERSPRLSMQDDGRDL